MNELSKKKCKPCEDKTGLLPKDEAVHLLEETDKWTIVENTHIEKSIRFKDFKSALNFINKVSEIAEQENHHPDFCLTSWNKVTFTLSTHSIGGLSENDFILAAKIDELSRE